MAFTGGHNRYPRSSSRPREREGARKERIKCANQSGVKFSNANSQAHSRGTMLAYRFFGLLNGRMASEYSFSCLFKLFSSSAYKTTRVNTIFPCDAPQRNIHTIHSLSRRLSLKCVFSIANNSSHDWLARLDCCIMVSNVFGGGDEMPLSDEGPPALPPLASSC